MSASPAMFIRGCLLALLVTPLSSGIVSGAQPTYRFDTVIEGGSPAPSASGRVRFGIAGVQQSPKKLGDPIDVGTTITAPSGLTVVIMHQGHAKITITPGTSLTLVATSDEGDAVVVKSGTALFDVLPHVFNFFRVGFRAFVASVRGTSFTVATSGDKNVTFACSRGVVDILRPGRLYIASEYRTVSNVRFVEQISASGTRSVTYSLNESQYVQRFGTLKDAESYFRRQFDEAQNSHDAVRADAALDSLFRLYWTLGRYDDRHAIALKRLAFFKAHRASLDERSLGATYTELAFSEPNVLALADVAHAIQIWHKLDPGEDESGTAEAEYARAEAYLNLGRYAEAFEGFDGAERIAERARSPLVEAAAIEDSGVVSDRLHDYATEISQFQRALGVMRAAYPSGSWPDNVYFYENLSLIYQYADNAQERAYYAELALRQWRKLIGDDSNSRVSSAVDRYVMALTDWGKLDEGLVAVNDQLETLGKAKTHQYSWMATLLLDRAAIYDLLLRRAEARSDRANAAMLRAKLPIKPMPKDRAGKLQWEIDEALRRGRKAEAARLTRQQVRDLESRGASPIAVADAEINLANLEHSANLTTAAIADWRKAIEETARIGELGRRRLAEGYDSVAGLEIDTHEYVDATKDAQMAISLATKAPVLAVQAAGAYRTLSTIQSDTNLLVELGDTTKLVVEFDKETVPFNPVQFAWDEDYSAAQRSGADQLPLAAAARQALAQTDVPAQNSVWADNDYRMSQAYYALAYVSTFDRSKMQLALDYAEQAYAALALRRPLLNDEDLALYTAAAAYALGELGRHAGDQRHVYLERAREEDLRAIRVLSNRLTNVTQPLRLADAYSTLIDTEMMLASPELPYDIRSELLELQRQEKKGLNRPNLTLHNILADYEELAQDAEIIYYDYDKSEPLADAKNTQYILESGEHLLKISHTPDENDGLYRYWLWIVYEQLGKKDAAAEQLSAAHSLLSVLPIEQVSLLRNFAVTLANHAGFGVWDDYPMNAAFFRAAADIDSFAVTEKFAGQSWRDDLIEDYRGITFADIFMRQPAEAIADANVGLGLAPGDLILEKNLGFGYLFSGDTQSAKALFLAHSDEKFADGMSLTQVVLKNLEDFARAGVTAAGADDIRTALAGDKG